MTVGSEPQPPGPVSHRPESHPPAQRPPVVPAVPDDGRVSLVDLLDRVLARGVVVSGELTLSIADVDLVHLSLRALLSSVRPGLLDGAGRDGADP
jgi:hypothetical protein